MAAGVGQGLDTDPKEVAKQIAGYLPDSLRNQRRIGRRGRSMA